MTPVEPCTFKSIGHNLRIQILHNKIIPIVDNYAMESRNRTLCSNVRDNSQEKLRSDASIGGSHLRSLACADSTIHNEDGIVHDHGSDGLCQSQDGCVDVVTTPESSAAQVLIVPSADDDDLVVVDDEHVCTQGASGRNSSGRVCCTQSSEATHICGSSEGILSVNNNEKSKTVEKDTTSTKIQKDILVREYKDQENPKTTEKDVKSIKHQKDISIKQPFLELPAVKEFLDKTHRDISVEVFEERRKMLSYSIKRLTSDKYPNGLKNDISSVRSAPAVSSQAMSHDDYCAKNALWKKVKRRIVALRTAELRLHDIHLKAQIACENIEAERLSVDDLINQFSDKWVAQSSSSPTMSTRRRVPTDDVDLRYLIERGDPPEVEYTEAFVAACEILTEVSDRCVLLGVLCKNIRDSEEKAHVRECMKAFYDQVDEKLALDQATEDLTNVFTQWKLSKGAQLHKGEWWHAQSSDALIRKLKIDERIQSNKTAKGLGKSRKKGHTSSKCYFRAGASRTAEPTSSFRSAARDKFHSGREAKSAKYEAQSMFNIGLDADASTKLDSVVAEMAKLNENGITLNVDIMSGLREKVTNIFSSGAPHIKYISVGVSIAYCAYKAYSTRGAIWKFLTTIISIAAACMGLQPHQMELVERFRKVAVAQEGQVDIDPVIFDADQDGEWVAQSGKENISTLILTYVYGSMFADLKGKNNKIVEYLKKSSDVPKWKHGLSSQIDFFTSLVQKFLNFMSQQFGMRRYVVEQLPYPEVYDFATEAEKLCNQFNGGLDLNYENGQLYYALEAKGKQLMTKIPSGTPEGRDARSMILLTLSSMKTIGSRLARANIVNNGPRIPPIGVILAGPSGIGKTDLMQFFMNAVTAQVIPEKQLEAFRKNHNDVTFTRASENGYWEGYHGQFNVYTDDLGQTRDVVGQPDNEYMEHIRMLGPGNYPLNMANLEDKGNVNFRSHAVYATTNRTHFDLQSLYYNEAFCRRFQIAYVMVPKIEYCKPGFQDSNVFTRRISHFPSSREDRSHLEFFPWDPEHGSVGDKSISYQELVDLTIAAYHRTHVDGALMMRLHQEDKEKELRKRFKENELPFVAQAGGDVETPVNVEDELEDLNLSEELLHTLPPEVNPADTKSVVRALARESSLSEAFVAANLRLQARDEPWPVLVARLVIKAEEVQNTVASSTDSLTTRVCRTYIDKCKPIMEAAGKVAANYKLLIASVIAAMAGLKVLWGYFGTIIPEAQSVGGMRHGKRDMSKPVTVRTKKGDKFSTFCLKPGKGRSNRGHVQLRGHRFEPQAGSDGNVVDIMRKVIKRNQYSIALPGSMEPLGRITFVVPYVAICPLHFGERMQYGVDQGDYDDESFITIWSVIAPDMRIEIPITSLDIRASQEGTENDWCLIRFPPVIERLPNILKYWAEDTRLADRGRFEALLNLVDKDVLVLQGVKAFPREGLTEYEDYQMTRGYQYDFPTTVGSCGGLLAQVNSQIPCGKIIGIHTAGTGYKGFAPRITRSAIEYALTGFDDEVDTTITKDEMDDEFDIDIEDNAVPGFKAQCYGRPVATMSKSVIKKSPLHNTYSKSVMAPAVLRPVRRGDDVIHPMEKTRLKYCTPVRAMEETLLRVVSDYILGSMNAYSVNGVPWDRPRVFSFEEAVQGIPDIHFMEGIPRNTSAGYPYKLDVPNGHKGKSHFFGDKDAYEFDSPYCSDLKDRVASVIEAAKLGERKIHVYMDFLKDERRPIEKIRSVSTRMVSASPLDLLIVHRMYFLDFVRWVMHNRIGNGSAVGVNCYSTEWEHSAKRLLEVVAGDKPCMIAGDYSGFDGSITTQIERAILGMINRWYNNPPDNIIRDVLWEEVCASRHIYDSVIYQWSGKNPSGCFMTTILNTLVNAILIVYSFVRAHLKQVDASIVDEASYHSAIAEALALAKDHLRYLCYGDDNLIAVSEKVNVMFNQQTFTGLLAEVGYKYTVESKDSSVVDPVRPISEVSFLKRGFVKSEMTGRYICPLELGVILEMPQWTTRRDVNYHDTKTNVETALKELSLHPREVFDVYAPRILASASDNLGFIPSITDYNTLQVTMLSSLELL